MGTIWIRKRWYSRLRCRMGRCLWPEKIDGIEGKSGWERGARARCLMYSGAKVARKLRNMYRISRIILRTEVMLTIEICNWQPAMWLIPPFVSGMSLLVKMLGLLNPVLGLHTTIVPLPVPVPFIHCRSHLDDTPRSPPGIFPADGPFAPVIHGDEMRRGIQWSS